jgi:beta-phosphoglucomutase
MDSTPANPDGRLRAVIFDFDGVLVDSEPLHFRSLRDALRPEGFEIAEQEYNEVYLAYDDRASVRIASERSGRRLPVEEVARLADRKAALFREMAPGVPFFPGARELVLRLAARHPVAIASGALRGEIERILEAGGLLHVFSAIVGADDVSHGKPHPEPYLSAMDRLEAKAAELEPESCLVFEDAVGGIAGALAAGMRVIGVAHSLPASKLAAAHLVVRSLAEADDRAIAGLFAHGRPLV